ncbi:hypothetical protein VOLCADRAFT_121420 [Volvox carteri f. nagariensis]|uniref:Uncharacterized protein n=1 Tax=Volvox carteri f. nagariensis TaxID=3068 RepID=D8U9Q3_VOLCA|nr:uncharacterized protein VOLCADRAFT_121420 [Volvox carteri f. nagariensis]EFJ43513.1 hypothetical protein VOLCADRAFT_121420 [Volvox carteri f. nagariensis]|eukprot:XP_002955442.1 hypothetical protein VOLCADRAFT_121420 [Volvox carteri f. nagariensis]
MPKTIMVPEARAIVPAIISLLAFLSAVYGYPKYWWDPSQGVMPEGNFCHAHPERAYPELEVDGFWLESPHGAPRLDPDITFEFRNAAGDLVSSLCPGASYALKGSFPLPSLVLLSSSEGRFTSPATTPGCPNRVDWGGSISTRAAMLFNATYAVPCNPSADINFRVTSASRGYPGTWAQASVTLTVDSSCAAASCPKSDIPPSPEATPSPPPLTSIPPSNSKPPVKKKPPPPPKRKPPPLPRKWKPPMKLTPSPSPAPAA